jgi:hypothetical protein
VPVQSQPDHPLARGADSRALPTLGCFDSYERISNWSSSFLQTGSIPRVPNRHEAVLSPPLRRMQKCTRVHKCVNGTDPTRKFAPSRRLQTMHTSHILWYDCVAFRRHFRGMRKFQIWSQMRPNTATFQSHIGRARRCRPAIPRRNDRALFLRRLCRQLPRHTPVRCHARPIWRYVTGHRVDNELRHLRARLPDRRGCQRFPAPQHLAAVISLG